MAESPPTFRYELSETIRRIALGYPETVEGSSCVNRAFKAGGKNFVFLGEKGDVCKMRLKLEDGGWTLLEFSPDEPPSVSELERWIDESFRLLAPKRVQKLREMQPPATNSPLADPLAP